MDYSNTGRPERAADVLEQHRHAVSLYRAANAAADQCVKLITEGLPIPQDRTDLQGAEVTQPVLAGAIVERLRQMLQVEANMRLRVLPARDGEREQAACSKLERWLAGFWRQTIYHSKRNPDRDLTWWYLATGRAYLEVRFRPDWLGTQRTPVEVLTDDPRSIFPVKGRGGETLWYTKEYKMYGRQLKSQVLQLQAGASALYDTGFVYNLENNRQYPVVEYWDKDYYCCLVDREHLLMSNEHGYGFCPLAEALCLDKPLAAAEWASQSVIGPVVEHLKQVYLLAAKMATGVNLFFYPLLYGVSPSGELIVIDPNKPGEVQQNIAPGTDLKVINVQVNAPMLSQLMGFFRADINLATIPETAWGTEPQSLESGFAIAQVLNQVQSAVQDKIPNLARGMADGRGNVLRLVETFGHASGSNFAVPADYDE